MYIQCDDDLKIAGRLSARSQILLSSRIDPHTSSFSVLINGPFLSLGYKDAESKV